MRTASRFSGVWYGAILVWKGEAGLALWVEWDYHEPSLRQNRLSLKFKPKLSISADGICMKVTEGV